MNVIPLHARRPRVPLAPPPALGHFTRATDLAGPFDAAEDRLRMLQNLGALIAVLVIVVLGAWLIERLSAASRTLACLEAGHRNCVVLDIEQPRPW